MGGDPQDKIRLTGHPRALLFRQDRLAGMRGRKTRPEGAFARVFWRKGG